MAWPWLVKWFTYNCNFKMKTIYYLKIRICLFFICQMELSNCSNHFTSFLIHASSLIHFTPFVISLNCVEVVISNTMKFAYQPKCKSIRNNNFQFNKQSTVLFMIKFAISFVAIWHRCHGLFFFSFVQFNYFY